MKLLAGWKLDGTSSKRAAVWAARVTIAEVEELVAVGTLDPDGIHVPSIYVQRIFAGTSYEKPIEQRTVRKR